MLHYLRNGKIFALAALIIVGMIMAGAHNRTTAAGRSFLPEDVIRVVLKPFEVVAHGVGGLFHSAGRSLRSRNAVRGENDRLRAEVIRLNREVIQLREDASEVKRLRSALGFKQQSPEKLLPSRIISSDPSEWFLNATIDRGRSSGVIPGQAVVSYRGLVGQVYEASPTSAQIRSLTDKDSGVGAMVQRSRAIGICQGQGQGQGIDILQMNYIAKDADVKVGDIVITSGLGGVFPKGVPIGRVTEVRLESGGFMKTAKVRPSVQLGQTEEVLVVLRQVN